jgi:hypothetical protein
MWPAFRLSVLVASLTIFWLGGGGRLRSSTCQAAVPCVKELCDAVLPCRWCCSA